jgi:hypothetical protein
VDFVNNINSVAFRINKNVLDFIIKNKLTKYEKKRIGRFL